MESKSPYLHHREFEKVYATINLHNITIKQLWLKLFLFSLKDKAKIWLHSLHPNAILIMYWL